MSFAVLALLLLPGSFSASGQDPDSARLRFSVSLSGPGAEDPATQQNVIDVYKQRLGKRAEGASFAAQPEDRALTIELGLRAAFDSAGSAKLGKDVSIDAQAVDLEGDMELPEFGVLFVDREWLSFRNTKGPTLNLLKRGLWETSASAHAAGTSVELFNIRPMSILLETRGDLAFLQGASREFLKSHDTDPDAEETRLRSWMEAHPNAAISELDSVPREKGGPLPGTIWRPHHDGALKLLRLPADESVQFTRDDIVKWGLKKDYDGQHALTFSFSSARAEAFSTWTEKIKGSAMAVLLDDTILTYATVRSRLPAEGEFGGGTVGRTKSETSALLHVLHAPVLKVCAKVSGMQFVQETGANK